MSLEVDGEAAEQCPVCEYVWGVKHDANNPDVWRFESHNRDHTPKKGKHFSGHCEGSHLTYDEAWTKKQEMDAQ
jgi:hypothetical protein